MIKQTVTRQTCALPQCTHRAEETWGRGGEGAAQGAVPSSVQSTGGWEEYVSLLRRDRNAEKGGLLRAQQACWDRREGHGQTGSFTDQCAPSKRHGAGRHHPFPDLFQKGYGAAGAHRLERLEKSVRISSGRCSVKGLHLWTHVLTYLKNIVWKMSKYTKAEGVAG